jgi:hypothetical protein
MAASRLNRLLWSRTSFPQLSDNSKELLDWCSRFGVLHQHVSKLLFQTYFSSLQAHKEARKPEVWSYQEPVYATTGAGILSRTGLNFTTKDVSRLWVLCKVEAALLNRTNQLCTLFTKDEVSWPSRI